MCLSCLKRALGVIAAPSLWCLFPATHTSTACSWPSPSLLLVLALHQRTPSESIKPLSPAQPGLTTFLHLIYSGPHPPAPYLFILSFITLLLSYYSYISSYHNYPLLYIFIHITYHHIYDILYYNKINLLNASSCSHYSYDSHQGGGREVMMSHWG